MAYTYAEVLNVIGRALPRVLEDQYSAVVANMATSFIWDALDWNESMASLPPFYLIPGEQDHGPPEPLVPADYLALRRAQIQNLDGQVISDLHVASNLNEVWSQGVPNMISYEQIKNAFRLHPRVPNGMGAPNYFVTGNYKKKPVQITNSTLQAPLPIGGDKDFPVWLEAVRYAFYRLSGDSKAGGVQIQGGRTIETGQLAIMNREIRNAAHEELRSRGENAFHPNKPLASPRGYGRY